MENDCNDRHTYGPDKTLHQSPYVLFFIICKLNSIYIKKKTKNWVIIFSLDSSKNKNIQTHYQTKSSWPYCKSLTFFITHTVFFHLFLQHKHQLCAKATILLIFHSRKQWHGVLFCLHNQCYNWTNPRSLTLCVWERVDVLRTRRSHGNPNCSKWGRTLFWSPNIIKMKCEE